MRRSPRKCTHTDPARRKDGRCRECLREYRLESRAQILAVKRTYRAKKRDELLAQRREYEAAYRIANGPQLRKNARRYRQNNVEVELARYRAWFAAEPIKARAISARRRARLACVECTLTAQDIVDITASQGGLCAICRKPKKLTVDHVIPLSKGGPHTRANVQMLCKSCNSRKGAKLPHELPKQEEAA